MIYIPVMQRFRLVYHRISHEAVLPIKYKRYTVLHRAIESTVVNPTNATYVRRMMGALSVEHTTYCFG